MRATPQDRDRLENEARRLAEQLKALGALKIILFGSLARGEISLFSDIDLLAVFDDPRSVRELTRWVYERIQTGESVDLVAYNQDAFAAARERPFIRHILREGKVLYERPQA